MLTKSLFRCSRKRLHSALVGVVHINLHRAESLCLSARHASCLPSRKNDDCEADVCTDLRSLAVTLSEGFLGAKMHEDTVYSRKLGCRLEQGLRHLQLLQERS